MTMPNPMRMTALQHPLGRALAVISAVGFVALFPYFFMYHFAISRGVIPPFMGGAFGILTVLIVLAAIIPYALVQHRFSRPALMVSVPFHLLVLYVLFWVGVNNLAPQNEFILGEATAQLLTLVVSWTALFVLGVFTPESDRTFRTALLGLWGLMVIIILTTFDRHTLAVDLSRGDEEIATYKELARSVMYVGLFLALVLKNRMYRLGLIAATIIALFFVGARSELLGFAGACMLTEALTVRRSLAGQILLGLVVLAMVGLVADNFDLLSTSRQSTLLDVTSDQSWHEREQALSYAISQIRDEPIMGVYGGHLLIGQAGFYAHNALSAWVSLGLVGFLLYISLTIYCAWTTFLEVCRNPEPGAWRLALAVNFISVLFLVAAQGVFWSLPALGWGLTLRARILHPPRGVAPTGRPVARPAVRARAPAIRRDARP